jgi:hypothetical protein
MAAVVKPIQRHQANLLTYLRHRLTNADPEGLNAVIQGVKKTAGRANKLICFGIALGCFS